MGKRFCHGLVSMIGTVSFLQSAGKFMGSVFWDSKGEIRIDFLPYGVTINAQYYNNLLHNDVHQVIWWETGKPSKIVLLYDMRLSTYGKFDKDDIGNNGLGNHEPPLAAGNLYLYQRRCT